jgi:cobyrinic acid a,c-diamide synthase
MSGLLIAAPASGSGKTTVTLGLLRAFKRLGITMSVGKAGPDYIDPAFHSFASGTQCLNFDPWAMRPDFLQAQGEQGGMVGSYQIIEAMMGVFDGAGNGQGAAADLAVLLDLNVVLVIDCSRMSHSIAALVHGFSTYRPDMKFRGVILNKVGSDRHETMLREALAGSSLPVLGVLPSDPALALPERHLGLVQAGEHHGLERFVDDAADRMERGCQIAQLLDLAQAGGRTVAQTVPSIPPLAQSIAIAQDVAFAFSYPHLLNSWKQQGASLSFFSPLADEGPDETADAIYLPGGYPELHAGRLSANQTFRSSMVIAAKAGRRIYGECGGYMVLGDALIDASGQSHAMLGLLPLVSSFQHRKRHLGYRRVRPLDGSFFDQPMTAHEYHHSTIVSEGEADRLFAVRDARGDDLGLAGLRRGHVAGSYMHLIDLDGGRA